MTLVRVMLCAGLLAGCLKPDLQQCGDLLCAADSVCLPTGTCATRDSIDACIDHVEGAACMTSFFTGACFGGVCTAPRCGDGLVSGSEQCDGSVSGVDCVDYGFDTGIPSCSSLCALDVVGSCINFGWKRVVAQSGSRAWTNGDLFAFLGPDGKKAEIYRDGALLQSADPPAFEDFYSLAGAGTTVVANTYSTIVRSDAGGPFVDVPTTGLPSTFSFVRVGDDGTIYVIAFYDAGVDVYRSTSSGFQQILTASQPAQNAKFTGGALYLMFTDGTVRRFVNGSWSGVLFTAPSPVTDIAERDGVLYVAANGSGAFQFANNALALMAADTYNSVAALPSGIYFGGGDTVVMRFKDGTQQMFFAPIYGFLFSDGTDIYTVGSGIYKLTGTVWSEHPGIGEPATDVSLLADNKIAITTVSEIFTDAGPYGWTYNAATEPEPISIAGHGVTDYYVTGGTLIEHFNGTTFTIVSLPAGTPAMADLAWDDSTSTLYVVGALGLGMKRVGTTWTRFADVVGCDLQAIFIAKTSIYAAGTCGTEGVVWSLAGTQWTEIHRSLASLASLWVDTSDNIYAAGPQGGVTRINGTWKDEPRAKGISIAATSPDDIWVGGGPDDVLHWDGTVWSRVAVIGPATPHVWATPSTVYVAGAKQTMLLR